VLPEQLLKKGKKEGVKDEPLDLLSYLPAQQQAIATVDQLLSFFS
jgi:hypothetical protein